MGGFLVPWHGACVETSKGRHEEEQGFRAVLNATEKVLQDAGALAELAVGRSVLVLR